MSKSCKHAGFCGKIHTIAQVHICLSAYRACKTRAGSVFSNAITTDMPNRCDCEMVQYCFEKQKSGNFCCAAACVRAGRERYELCRWGNAFQVPPPSISLAFVRKLYIATALSMCRNLNCMRGFIALCAAQFDQ